MSSNDKLVRLKHLNTLASRVKSKFDSLKPADIGAANNDLSNVSDSAFVNKVVSSKAHAAPVLSNTRRVELLNLCNSYYNNRKYIEYTGDITRNILANKNCYNDDGTIRVNCSLFCQMIWAGISLDTFINKSETYDGTITKAFDWGYYFKFPRRAAYGITTSEGKYFGYVQPTPGSIEGSYSMNSFYSSSADNEYGQIFRTYMYAADMASELEIMGCEIPLGEVMVGDLVFLKCKKGDGVMESYEDRAYRNIDHAAIVTNVGNKADGDITFLECSTYYASSVGTAKLSATADANIVRAAELFDRIVMVARHPAAFGHAPNVPDVITKI